MARRSVEKGPAISEGGSTALKGVRIVGDLTGVLLKFSADSEAKAVQAILQEPDTRAQGHPKGQTTTW